MPPRSASARKLRTIVALTLFAVVGAVILVRALAASGGATLYTSPAGNQSVKKGESFSLSVRIATGNDVPVTGAVVYLKYPLDKLQVANINYSGSAYGLQIHESNSGGILRMDRASLPMIPGGDKLFATITFRTLNQTGSAPISFTDDSKVFSGEDDSNILNKKQGVNYTITQPTSSSPAQSPPPAVISPPSGNSSGSSGNQPNSSPGSSSSAPPPSTSSSAGTNTSNGSSSPAPNSDDLSAQTGAYDPNDDFTDEFYSSSSIDPATQNGSITQPKNSASKLPIIAGIVVVAAALAGTILALKLRQSGSFSMGHLWHSQASSPGSSASNMAVPTPPYQPSPTVSEQLKKISDSNPRPGGIVRPTTTNISATSSNPTGPNNPNDPVHYPPA